MIIRQKDVYSPIEKQPDLDFNGNLTGSLKSFTIQETLDIDDRVKLLDNIGTITQIINQNWVIVHWDHLDKNVKEWANNIKKIC